MIGDAETMDTRSFGAPEQEQTRSFGASERKHTRSFGASEPGFCRKKTQEEVFSEAPKLRVPLRSAAPKLRVFRALALLLLSISACSKPDSGAKPGGPPAAARKPRVAVAEVREQEVEYVVDATGSIEAREEVSIPARVSGILDKVNFKEGDVVTPDTVLAEIETDRYELALRVATAARKRADEQKKLAETLYTNREKLQAEGRKQNKEWVTEEQMATWKADLEKAKADLDRADAEMQLARKNRQDAEVRPPIAGVIHQKLVSQGSYAKTETILATMMDMSRVFVRFTVPELEAARLRLDQEVKFRLRTTARGEWLKARLFHIGQKVDERTRAVECKAEVVAPTADLRAGTFATVQITYDRKMSVHIPERAVLPTERGLLVFVLEGTKVRSVLVELGLRVQGGVEIRSGLKPGDRIVVDGASSLRDGIEVDTGEKK